MALYRIAGLNVEMTPLYETLTKQSEAYLSSESSKPDITVSFGDAELGKCLAAYPYLTPNDAEYIFTGAEFYSALLEKGGFLLHSSAVELDGNAYLFSAKSGTGKSTHTSMWLKAFGDRARIINDDKPAVMLSGGIPTVYGTPWSGKTDLNLNISVPLKAIAFLKRGDKNRIYPISAEKALPLLLDQTLRPASKAEELLCILDRLLKAVPIYMLECNISTEAAEVAYNTMKETRK